MKGRTHRGFAKHGSFKTTWHGEVRVQESSAAFKGACVWIFADKAYSNEPLKDPPRLHLSYVDAVHLRDGLIDFIGDAENGKLKEPVKKTRPKAGL